MQKTEQDPSFKSNRLIKEAELNRVLANLDWSRVNIITIPVVFHVFHNGDAIGQNENLSDAQLQAALDQLNDDYSRSNSDAGNTPAAFAGIAANTNIQFCLASQDPNGSATSGINRVDINTLGNVNESACWRPTYIDNRIVKPHIWDRDSYLNIFTLLRIDYLDGGCQTDALLGYAQLPGGPADTDAAVHAYFTIGSLSNPNPDGGVYGLGRTVTHEVGHWLNLDHVWGAGGRAAGNDDLVADTPNQFEENYDCPNFPLTDNCTSGGNGVMFMNYMDYVNDDCMNMFTAGQGARMVAAINTYRPGLMATLCNGGNNCPPIYNTGAIALSTGAYEASQTVISTGTVPNNADVRLSGNDSVCLDSGFSVVLGGELLADLQGCN